MRQKVLDLTIALYRVTDLFPKDEVLRRQIREKANDILSYFFECEYAPDIGEDSRTKTISRLVHSLRGYFQLATALGLVDPRNLLVLEREYSRITQFLPLYNKDIPLSQDDREESSLVFSNASVDSQKDQDFFRSRRRARPSGSSLRKNKSTPGASADQKTLNQRQKKMTEHLQSVPTAPIGDFTRMFPHVSMKTVQRDIQALVQKNIFQRKGKKRWAVYSLKFYPPV